MPGVGVKIGALGLSSSAEGAVRATAELGFMRNTGCRTRINMQVWAYVQLAVDAAINSGWWTLASARKTLLANFCI